jgi:hypothetical protein
MKPIIHHHKLENPCVQKLFYLPLLQALHIDVPFKDLYSANNQIFFAPSSIKYLKVIAFDMEALDYGKKF